MEITTAMIKELREKTGAGILDCKAALAESKGDLAEAEKALRKKGLAAAAKKATRTAADGLIGYKCDGQTAALVELNSETDFVAKLDDFKAARQILAGLVFASSELGNTLDGDVAKLLSMPAPADLPGATGTISDWTQAFTAKTGENTQLRRFCRFVAAEGAALTLYVHQGDKTVVLLETKGCDEALAKDIAMHTAALSPQFVSRDAVPEKTLADEREIARAKAAQSGKPEAVVEKMVEGMIGKWASETVLLEQAFAKDDTKKVSQVLAERGAKGAAIVRFARFRVGEGIEKKQTDLAADVAAMTQ
ncbi:MAG: translation elongation factor Ts [Thermoanaerobaculia bacterium]|nr:Elongation factor Ts [Thermoanaerobaculia bacterium]MCK6681761.1 translation elongation factor Ts [Thermoanaerobaculia bacterium]